MDQSNLVHEITVEYDGKRLKATYFLEGNAIHAMVGDKSYRLGAGKVPVDTVIRSFLMEQLAGDGDRLELSGDERLRRTL